MPNQVIPLARECLVTEIPSGSLRILSCGTPVMISQSLGGSYTVTTGYGELLRIDARDADALGFPVQQPCRSAGTFSEQLVWEQLKTVYDPEIPVNIVDLGLVYSCSITEENGQHRIHVTMSLTAPGCGMSEVLRSDVMRKLADLPTVGEVQVEIVFDPPWSIRLMSEAARLHLGLD